MNFLYGNQRKLLKIIYKNNKKNKFLTISELSKQMNLTINETAEICYSFQRERLIVFIGLDSRVKITPQGMDYFSAETITSFETVFKSILCPIIVSFITTLLTLMLKERL